MSFDVNTIPATLYSLVTYAVSIINSFLAVLGKDNEPYVVILISVTLGWFMQMWIRDSKNPIVWFVIISMILFLALRYLGVGG